MTEPIKGVAQVSRIQTLADGGIRWTIDAPETAIYQSAALMELKRGGIAFDYVLTPRTDNDSDDIWQGVDDAE